MPPRRRDERAARSASSPAPGKQLPWAIVYYKAPDGTTPALEFLDSCPGNIDAKFTAVLDPGGGGPPPPFPGGGKWEGMPGGLGGWDAIRLTGPGAEAFPVLRPPESGRHHQLCRPVP